jgi:hypothetical protein
MLSLEDFAARCLWMEHIQISAHLGPHEERKHFRRTLARIRRGDLGLNPRTAWTAMVEDWYGQYLREAL